MILPSEAVQPLSLEIFQNRLGAILRNVIQDDPAGAWTPDQMTHRGPVLPYLFWD